MKANTKLSLQGVKQLLTRRQIKRRYFVEVEVVEIGHFMTTIRLNGVEQLIPQELIVEVEDGE